jgi:hypothetical protein
MSANETAICILALLVVCVQITFLCMAIRGFAEMKKRTAAMRGGNK